jgi:hypothetical protein
MAFARARLIRALDGFAMKRRISSLYTPLMKLLPVPFIMGVLVLIVISILGHKLPVFPDGLIALSFTLAVLGFFSWHSSRLKFVGLDDDNLYVSGWFTGSVIPLSEVEDVYYFGGVGLVFVRLKSESYFGYTIAFMPTWGLYINSHPIVEELRGLAKEASAQ